MERFGKDGKIIFPLYRGKKYTKRINQQKDRRVVTEALLHFEPKMVSPFLRHILLQLPLFIFHNKVICFRLGNITLHPRWNIYASAFKPFLHSLNK